MRHIWWRICLGQGRPTTCNARHGKIKNRLCFLLITKLGSARDWLPSGMWKGKKRQTIQEPRAHADYIRSVNGVDPNDWDSHDYSTSIRTNRWYIWIFAGHWIRLFMLNTLSWHFLLSRVLESRNGRNIGTKIRANMISKLILGYLFSTMVSALTAMEYQKRDQATCKLVHSSLVIVSNASSVCRAIRRYYPSSTKASKSNCGVQMRNNACEDEQVYQRAGESWVESSAIL